LGGKVDKRKKEGKPGEVLHVSTRKKKNVTQKEQGKGVKKTQLKAGPKERIVST